MPNSFHDFFSKYGDLYGEKKHRVAIYVPEATEKHEQVRKTDVTATKLLDAVKAFLVDKFGGCSVIAVKGYYLNKDGVTVTEENTNICFAYAEKDELEKAQNEVQQMANAIAIEYGQSSVAVEVDGRMFFYSPTVRYRRQYESYLAGKDNLATDKLHSYRRYVNKDWVIDSKSQRVDAARRS